MSYENIYFKHLYMKKIILILIRLYQKILSPDHSFWAKKKHSHGYCRFFPSCSEYGYRSIEKYGIFRGGAKTVWRVFRCNPWGKGGFDDI